MKDSNSLISSLDPLPLSKSSVEGGLGIMVVLMLGVTLLVALAMRHLAVMFSLDASKRDTRGVETMAMDEIGRAHV